MLIHRNLTILSFAAALLALGCCCQHHRCMLRRDCESDCNCSPAVPIQVDPCLRDPCHRDPCLRDPYLREPCRTAPYPREPYQREPVLREEMLPGPQSRSAIPGQEHMHVFLINGMDFLGRGKMQALAVRLRESGYSNTKYGQVYHSGEFLTQVCDAWQKDPEAKIVLVGFSAGAYCAHALAQDLNKRDVPVALLVYMAADLVKDRPSAWPVNAERLLNVYGEAVLPIELLRTESIKGAHNLKLRTAHIAVPRNRATIAALAQELEGVLSTVGVSETPEVAAEVPTIGTPRPTVPIREVPGPLVKPPTPDVPNY